MSHCSDPVQVEGRSSLRISIMSTLTPNYFAHGWPWISLMVFPAGVLHGALVPPSLAPEEQTLWERNTYKRGMCWTYQTCIGGEFGA